MSGRQTHDSYYRNLVRSYVLTAGEYAPPPDGVFGIVKLSANENDFGTPPAVRRAIEEQLKRDAGLSRYPDSTCAELRRALSAQFALPADWFLVGNGLDDVINMLAMTFLNQGDEVVIPAMTFGVYEGAAQLLGAHPISVAMRDDLSIDVDGMAAAVTGQTKMLFLCHPNNPTGTVLSGDAFERLLETLASFARPPLLIMDQAYIDYAQHGSEALDAASYLRGHRNLVVLRTFSKISALAGLRVGYAIAHPGLLEFVNRVRPPFTVNSLAQAAAIVDVGDEEVAAHKERVRRSVEKSRGELEALFEELGQPYVRSQANFVFALHDREYDELLDISQRLQQAGLLVRTLRHRQAPSGIRFTIGTEEENRRLIEALRGILC